jgi:hypothetical protein
MTSLAIDTTWQHKQCSPTLPARRAGVSGMFIYYQSLLLWSIPGLMAIARQRVCVCIYLIPI